MPIFNLTPDYLSGGKFKNDVTPVMFGGEQAIGAPLESLKGAKELQAAGEPSENIYEKTKTPTTTGWFQGPEGKWRFEFSDKEAKFNPNALAQMHRGEQIKLEQLLQHPELFKYYPHLKDVNLQSVTPEEEESGLLGSYNSTTNVLKLLKDPAKARSTLMHELQHMIQSKEKWAKGGSDEAPGELVNLSEIYKTSDYLKDKIEKIIQIEKEFDPKLKAAKSVEEHKKLLDERDDAWKKVNEVYANRVKEQENIENKVNQFKRNFSNYEIYKRLGGETEARNVQNRLMMDLIQRQKSLPTKTQDIPYEGQLSITD